jgi:hypothetical protein
MGKFEECAYKTKDGTCKKTRFDDRSQIHGLYLKHNINHFGDYRQDE